MVDTARFSWVLKKLPLRLFICVFVVSVVYGAIRVSNVFKGLSTMPYTEQTLFTLSAFGPLIFCYIIAIFAYNHGIRFAIVLTLPLIALGSVMVSTEVGAFFGLGLVTFGAETITLFVWLYFIEYAVCQGMPVLGMFAFLLAMQYLGHFVGQGLIAGCLLPVEALDYFDLIALLVVALVIVGIDKPLLISHAALKGVGISDIEAQVDALCRKADLSPRECEVLSIWVRGHNSEYIENTLHISKNTVKTHLKHIYEKTNTSSREELLALLG
jgi:DNA-binding CsgD family transcriptional regulator